MGGFVSSLNPFSGFNQSITSALNPMSGVNFNPMSGVNFNPMSNVNFNPMSNLSGPQLIGGAYNAPIYGSGNAVKTPAPAAPAIKPFSLNINVPTTPVYTDVKPFYKITDPTQAQYYWGTDKSKAPATPWSGNQPNATQVQYNWGTPGPAKAPAPAPKPVVASLSTTRK